MKKLLFIRSHFSTWFIIIISLILSLPLCILTSLITSDVYGKKQKNISDGEGFVEALKANSTSANSDVEYHLVNEFTLTEKHLSEIYNIRNQSFETGAWFYGKLIGHGFKITIDTIVTAPLFDRICEGAIIEGINLKCDRIAVTAQMDQLALLTKDNYGTIQDISITGTDSGFMEISFNNEMPQAVSALCVNNFNEILKCAVKTRIVSETVYCKGYEKLGAGIRWSCFFGAISAYCADNGKIKGAIAWVDFGDDFTPLLLRRYNYSNDVNERIGYFVGYAKDYSSLDQEEMFYLIEGNFIDNVIDFIHILGKKKNYMSNDENIEINWSHWNRGNFPQVDKY